MTYAAAANRADRAKAITAVAAVHVLLAVLILSGLNVRMVGETIEHLRTFDVIEVPPPPPVKPPPAPKPQQMKEPAGAPGKKAEPSPVVAPRPRLPVRSPLPAAKVAGSGNASTSGAALAGSGTGAGRAGNGLGGGGSGAYTPARKLTKIPDREYRRLAESGIRRGSVAITILINPNGYPSNCRIARSSGSPYADSLMCQLTLQYVRFSPALDPQGRPVAQDVTWTPNWAPGRW